MGSTFYDIPTEHLEIVVYDPYSETHGYGGQHVLRPFNGVKVTHTPSGTVAMCHVGRSQHVNRAIAMDMILSAVTHPRFDR